MRVRIAVIALIFIMLGIGSLDAKTVHGKPSPYQKASNDAKRSNPPERGTDGSPIVVKVIPATPTKAESDKQDAEDKEKSSNYRIMVSDTDWIAGFTGGLFLLAIVTACIVAYQAKWMRETVGEMKRAYDVTEKVLKQAAITNDYAQEANELTRQTLEDARITAQAEHERMRAAQRPVILLESFDVEFWKDQNIVIVKHSWKNYGPTVTLDLRCGYMSAHTDDFSIVNHARDVLERKQIIPAGTTNEGREDYVQLVAFTGKPAGDRFMYFFGWAVYKDVFGDPKTYNTEFCYRVEFVGPAGDGRTIESHHFIATKHGDMNTAN